MADHPSGVVGFHLGDVGFEEVPQTLRTKPIEDSSELSVHVLKSLEITFRALYGPWWNVHEETDNRRALLFKKKRPVQRKC